MESDSGRYQDPQGSKDTAQQVLCKRTAMDTLQGGATQKIRPRHQNFYSRTVGTDRRDIQKPSGTNSSVAFDTVYISQTRDVGLVDDWMNPWPIPGEKLINTIKETYDKIKKRFST